MPASELDQTADALAERLVRNSPQAMAAAKELMDFVSTRPIDAETVEGTVERIARQRAGAEGRDGVAAFLEKRLPRWRKS